MEQEILIAIKGEKEIKFHKLTAGTEVPLRSLAPEYVVYQRKEIEVAGRQYKLVSVASQNKVVHYVAGEIIFNHIAPIDDSGRISKDVPFKRTETTNDAGDIAYKFSYSGGELDGEEIQHINLIIDGVMCFEISNGDLSGTHFIHPCGSHVNLFNINQGAVCTGVMPITDNPKRLLATIMQNRGNMDFSKDVSPFDIEEHPTSQDLWIPKGIKKGSKTSIGYTWLEVKN